MKLRIHGQTIRVRIDQHDLEQLLRDGRVTDETRFGDEPDRCFSCLLEIAGPPNSLPGVDYDRGRFVIQLGRDTANDWRNADLVGFKTTREEGGRMIRLMLEKDFACLDRPVGEEREDAYAFLNPAEHC
ncbi:MAG TPA: hypothetical protein VM452_05125 [Caulifigura sp.]|jgi:hypothetical protein|nr:hypothetical protein [Caulifigura sp.]